MPLWLIERVWRYFRSNAVGQTPPQLTTMDNCRVSPVGTGARPNTVLSQEFHELPRLPLESRKHRLQILIPQIPRHDFAKHEPEVRRHR
jgi:hypothetical protein